MTALITEQHYARVRLFKQLLSSFQRNRDLVSVGAYAKGSDPMLDKAITLWPQLEAFLQQGIFERADWEDSAGARFNFPDGVIKQEGDDHGTTWRSGNTQRSGRKRGR